MNPCHGASRTAQPLGRRRLLLSAAAACVGSVAGSSLATTWPHKPLQLIVPWPAGGATDLTLRVLCEEVSPLLGQPVVIVNRPGAAGTLVAPLLKAAPADGHTLGQVPITVYRHALMNPVPWNPLADLSPVLQVSGTTFGVLVPAKSAFHSLAALLAWARAHPGELLMGSTGIGSTPHLAMEDILQQHGLRHTHVPYKGTTDQMLALASGQLMAGVNSTGFAPWVEQGSVRLLAVFGASRSPRWPEVPTLRELGYERAVYTSPWGLAVPRGVDEAVVAALHTAFHQAVFRPRHMAELARYDQQVDYLDTAAYRQAVADTVERETRLLRRLNLLATR
jgi:tripartite-type tricarboxylate transporter receptor subunit TctC